MKWRHFSFTVHLNLERHNENLAWRFGFEFDTIFEIGHHRYFYSFNLLLTVLFNTFCNNDSLNNSLNLTVCRQFFVSKLHNTISPLFLTNHFLTDLFFFFFCVNGAHFNILFNNVLKGIFNFFYILAFKLTCMYARDPFFRDIFGNFTLALL